eukprot:g168.t1
MCDLAWVRTSILARATADSCVNHCASMGLELLQDPVASGSGTRWRKSGPWRSQAAAAAAAAARSVPTHELNTATRDRTISNTKIQTQRPQYLSLTTDFRGGSNRRPRRISLSQPNKKLQDSYTCSVEMGSCYTSSDSFYITPKFRVLGQIYQSRSG